MSEYDFDASDESVEAAVTAAYKQARREEEDAEARAQYLNFAILIGVFVIVVLVVALTAPFITQRIVGAVMGENLPQAVLINEVMEENAASEMEEVTPVGETVMEEETAASEEAPVAAPQTHTVQSGDTLYSIARQYNVAVDALVAANNLSDPGNITVGAVLTIPESE